ncbi:MAG: hypothetical protein JXB49_10355 [Bacteroidales bacterium]|nr:hypothetical protein [Bacteroidales bacterium]
MKSVITLFLLLNITLANAQTKWYENTRRLYDFPIEYAFAVSENNKWGVTDTSGKLVIPIIYDEIIDYGYFKADTLEGQFFLIDNNLVPVVKDTLKEATVYGKYTEAPAGYCAPSVDIFIWNPAKGSLDKFAAFCSAVSKQYVILVGVENDGVWTIEATNASLDALDEEGKIIIKLVFFTYLGKRTEHVIPASAVSAADDVLSKMREYMKLQIINTKKIAQPKYIDISKNSVLSPDNENYPGYIVRVYHPRYSFYYDYNLVTVEATNCCCFYEWQYRVSK